MRDTRWARKKITAFIVVLIAEFRLWSGSQNLIISNVEREPQPPSLLPLDIRKRLSSQGS